MLTLLRCKEGEGWQMSTYANAIRMKENGLYNCVRFINETVSPVARSGVDFTQSVA